MSIKAHKAFGGARDLYYLNKEDSKKLRAILKRYNIKEIPICYDGHARLIFWKKELEYIEKQYKLNKSKNKEKK